MTDAPRRGGPTRRALLVGGTAGALATGCARGGGTAAAPPTGPSPFRGRRQQGVVDPPPAHASFVGLDLLPGAGIDGARRLTRVWTEDAADLTAGRGPLTDLSPELVEGGGGLTVTLGLGPGFFDATGLARRRPEWLAPLPHLAVDRLRPAWGQTDLVLQLCAQSPIVLAHARRHLTQAATRIARTRWVQDGFREPGAATWDATRNLFGQVDGTVNPAVDGADDGLLWCGPDDGWMRDGSSLVLRRIRMDLDAWDRVDRPARENAIGRHLSDGSPLTGGGPAARADPSAVDGHGMPVLDPGSHVARARARGPRERFLRRPYTYEEHRAGRTETGLLFAAYQADPVEQFLPVQRRLADKDLLNIWTTAVGSAVYALPPGPGEGTLAGGLLG